jgi:hypothetical protein
LVENVSHPISVVPLGTKYGDIASLTGRQTCHDTVSSTNIKSLTGFSDPVIARAQPEAIRRFFHIFLRLFIAEQKKVFTFAAFSVLNLIVEDETFHSGDETLHAGDETFRKRDETLTAGDETFHRRR